MKSIVLSMLFCMILVLVQLFVPVLCTGNVQAQFLLFSLFTCDGAAVYVGSKPVKSFGVGSQGQCVVECKRQQRQGPEPCVGVNYRQENNVCDIFSDVDDFTNFTNNEPECQYTQVCISCRNQHGLFIHGFSARWCWPCAPIWKWMSTCLIMNLLLFTINYLLCSHSVQ